MDKLDKQDLKSGVVVQLSPGVRNQMFAGCFMIITEVKDFGAQGYVQALGQNGEPGGQAYYRTEWDEMEVIGLAAWTAQ